MAPFPGFDVPTACAWIAAMCWATPIPFLFDFGSMARHHHRRHHDCHCRRQYCDHNHRWLCFRRPRRRCFHHRHPKGSILPPVATRRCTRWIPELWGLRASGTTGSSVVVVVADTGTRHCLPCNHLVPPPMHSGACTCSQNTNASGWPLSTSSAAGFPGVPTEPCYPCCVRCLVHQHCQHQRRCNHCCHHHHLLQLGSRAAVDAGLSFLQRWSCDPGRWCPHRFRWNWHPQSLPCCCYYYCCCCLRFGSRCHCVHCAAAVCAFCFVRCLGRHSRALQRWWCAMTKRGCRCDF
mmetsp:Transcript_15567/g.43682  ORF Transcript_15567/g.43682 Transcript_15567/m.43682 type:complete len:292 (-) Transcript_15567:467-1342(-)